jgi:hypothetical protein
VTRLQRDILQFLLLRRVRFPIIILPQDGPVLVSQFQSGIRQGV